MHNLKHIFATAVVGFAVLFGSAVTFAYTPTVRGTPVLTQIYPRGVQRGTEMTFTFAGQRLFDPKEAFFYDEGFDVKKIEFVNDKSVKVTVAVSEACRIGEHVVQLRTAAGVTDYRNFFVGVLPEITEAEPNSEFNAPQKIESGTTVNGVIQNEDVDWFQIEATKGQRISVEIEAIRLGFMFDPYIEIRNAEGDELAKCDDCPLTKQDGHFSIHAPEDGAYTIMVRETSYGGNGNCHYRLHVGDFPRPALVYPAGGKFGETKNVTFLGDPGGPMDQSVSLPSAEGFRTGLFCKDDSGVSPSPLPFLLSNLNSFEEVEPNDTFTEQKAHSLPCAIDGILAEGDNADFHRFTAKKGETWVIDCHARSLGSPLDPVINVFHANKKHIAGNDDVARKPDAQMRFKVPEDGDYFVRVLDHLRRSGDDFVYRLQIQAPEPELTVNIRRNDRFSQRRQQIAIPKGNRFGLLMDAARKNFAGQIKLIAESLPPGVTMDCKPMASNMTYMPVVFSATEDAVIDGGLFEINAAHVDEEKNIKGGYRLRADLVLGVPNNTLYYPCFVDKAAVAVLDPVPFKLEMVPPKAPLLRDGQSSVKIKIHRDEGFENDIWLQFPFRPPGVGTNYQIKVSKDKTEFDYPLNANGNAQIGKWPVYVIGWSDVKGQAWVSTQLSEIEIAQPRVKMQMAMTNVTQGESAEMKCTLDQLEAFEGEAVAELLGVPPNVKTNSPLKFDSKTETLTFKFETSEKSPPGKHGPFVRVKIPQNGETMIATAGRGQLRINKPRPPKKKKVAAK